MKKRLLIISLMLMTGILLANPGYRIDHHGQVRYKTQNGRKVIIVKPRTPKFVLRFDVDPYDRYYGYRNYSKRRSYNDYYDRHDKYDRYNSCDNHRHYRYNNLEVIRRHDIEPLIDRLERYYERGMIDKKEYYYVSQELREMVGKMYPRDYAEDHIEDIVEQIADLHRLRRRGMISSYEYEKYKNEILKML